MNKQISVTFLIIVSIFVLALKDSFSLIHTVLHYIPNNPWHHHEEISEHKHGLNPLEIHKYLEHKHAYNSSAYAHNVMDHMQYNVTESSNQPPAETVKLSIKIDCYYQSLSVFNIYQYAANTNVNHFSIYVVSIRNRSVHPLCQPPQV